MPKVIKPIEYQDILNAGRGYVYNDFSPSGSESEYNILHSSSCYTLSRSNLTYDKYFFESLHEAERWLKNHRGESWKKCQVCFE